MPGAQKSENVHRPLICKPSLVRFALEGWCGMSSDLGAMAHAGWMIKPVTDRNLLVYELAILPSPAGPFGRFSNLPAL
jgi:hypothetical protein